MKSRRYIWVIGAIAIAAIIGLLLLSAGRTFPKTDGKHDRFAKCLTDQGVKMYGAYWCPHCANQKEMFGDSFMHINYVECSLPNKAGQTKECKDAGIESYPTWEFKGGQRMSGELSLPQLSEQSGCSPEGQ